jgi:hypothetical protein
MKSLLILFFVMASFGAVAQRSSYSKNITTDGQQLHIRVYFRDQNRSLHYSRSFDVSDLSRKEVQALEKRVVDSLEVSMAWPTVETASASNGDPEVSEKRNDMSSAKAVAKVSDSQIAYQETVEENLEEARLKVSFAFKAGGQNNVVERTAIIRNTTDEGRQKLRKEIQRQLTREMETLAANLADV